MGFSQTPRCPAGCDRRERSGIKHTGGTSAVQLVSHATGGMAITTGVSQRSSLTNYSTPMSLVGKGGAHKDRKKDTKKYQSRKKGLTKDPEREIL